MTTAPDIIDTWYLVFAGSIDPGRRWWSALTSPGFRHVWAYRQVAIDEDASLVGPRLVAGIHAVAGGVFVEVSSASPIGMARGLVLHGDATDVLIVKSNRTRPPSPLPGLLNCVTLAKALIGMRAWWCWTPELLYFALLRRGARSILQETAHDGRHHSGDLRGRPESAGA